MSSAAVAWIPGLPSTAPAAIRRILQHHRIPPAPVRRTDTIGRRFLRIQTTSMLAIEFVHVDCAVTLRRFYVVFVIEVGDRHLRNDNRGKPAEIRGA